MHLKPFSNDSNNRLSLLPRTGPLQLIENYVNGGGCINVDSPLCCRKTTSVAFHPKLIAVNNEGTILVIDSYLKVHRIGPDGSHKKIGQGTSLACSTNGEFYVMNCYAAEIVVYSSRGEHVRKITSDLLRYAKSIAVSNDGMIFVSAPASTMEIVILDSRGTFKWKWSVEQAVTNHAYVAYNPRTDSIAITDTQHILLYTLNGELVQKVGSFAFPHSIAFDAAGSMVVADRDRMKLLSPETECRFCLEYSEIKRHVPSLAVDHDGQVLIPNESECSIGFWS